VRVPLVEDTVAQFNTTLIARNVDLSKRPRWTLSVGTQASAEPAGCTYRSDRGIARLDCCGMSKLNFWDGA
jgi:hypothetical protein